MIVKKNFNLLNYNTFKVSANTRYFIEFGRIEEYYRTKKILKEFSSLPKLILGYGSNILFSRDFDGIVIRPFITGKRIIQSKKDEVYIELGAGERWDNFVKYSIDLNLYGIENLSFIPGSVGAAPVQNISSYDTEVQNTIYKVNAINVETGEYLYFNNKECMFGYRDSIFKQNPGKYIIVSVIFKLKRAGKYVLTHKDLLAEVAKTNIINLQNIRRAIKKIREEKLPDWRELGNAGSFFKNPVVSRQELDKLKGNYPDIVYRTYKDRYMLSAAWLIEQCGLKTQRYKNTGIYKKHALVLVNYGEASGKDILELANNIKEKVHNKFNILLKEEVYIV